MDTVTRVMEAKVIGGPTHPGKVLVTFPPHAQFEEGTLFEISGRYFQVSHLVVPGTGTLWLREVSLYSLERVDPKGDVIE